MNVIDTFCERAGKIDPPKYTKCVDAKCHRLHGGRHRVQLGAGETSPGNRLRRVAGLARALRLRIGTEPDAGGGEHLDLIYDWAKQHCAHKDGVAQGLAIDLLAAVKAARR